MARPLTKYVTRASRSDPRSNNGCACAGSNAKHGIVGTRVKQCQLNKKTTEPENRSHRLQHVAHNMRKTRHAEHENTPRTLCDSRIILPLTLSQRQAPPKGGEQYQHNPPSYARAHTETVVCPLRVSTKNSHPWCLARMFHPPTPAGSFTVTNCEFLRITRIC